MSADEVVWIHLDLVERFFTEYAEDTSYGVLNQSMLESAVGRPQQSAGGIDAYPTLEEKAASLTHSLILNHAFIDANKRTGILSGAVFIMLNGGSVVTPQSGLYQVAIAVESKELDFRGLVDWYRDPANILELTTEEWDQIQDELDRRDIGLIEDM